MLEIIFEFIARIVFGIIAEAILQPILEQVFRFFNIPIVDAFFSVLAKILAVCLVILFCWVCFQLVCN
jgi:hypothetical protein